MTASLTTRPPTTVPDPRGCDRCGAPSVNRFVLPAGTDLVFCGHHSREYGDRLLDGHATLAAL